MRNAVFLAVMMTLISVASAQAAADKIGVFNSRAVASQCKPFTDARTRIENQFKPEKDKLENRARQLQQQAEQLQQQAQGNALTREALNERSDRLMRERRTLEDDMQSYTRKVEAALIRIDQEFTQRLYLATQEYGKAQKFAAVLDTASGAVVYYDASVDVTKAMVDAVNNNYRRPLPAPGAAK